MSWLEARDAATHPRAPRRTPPPSAHPPPAAPLLPSAKNYPGQNITSADADKPSCRAKLGLKQKGT